MYWLYDKAGHSEKKGRVFVGPVLLKRKNDYLERKYIILKEKILIVKFQNS